MSDAGQYRKSRTTILMSVLPPKADENPEKADLVQRMSVMPLKRKSPKANIQHNLSHYQHRTCGMAHDT